MQVLTVCATPPLLLLLLHPLTKKKKKKKKSAFDIWTVLTLITTVESKLMLNLFPSWTFPVKESQNIHRDNICDVNRLVIAIEDIEIKWFSSQCVQKRYSICHIQYKKNVTLSNKSGCEH